MQNADSNEGREVFYGQIDTYAAVKDYQRGGLCVRVYAVEENRYDPKQLASAEGVRITTLDIGYWRYCRSVLGENSWVLPHERFAIDSRIKSPEERARWYQFTVRWNGARRDGYAYSAFGQDSPQFFELVSSQALHGGHVIRPPPRQRQNTIRMAPIRKAQMQSSRRAPTWSLTAYHVGQGMCSLVSNGVSGILLDCGAGTPVKRPKYLHDSHFVNELATAVAPLRQLDLVLSHADADHWRVIAWDAAIRTKLRRIYLPSGAKSLAFKDPAVVQKTRQVSDLTFILSSRCSMYVYRSQPAEPDDNGDCLVAVLENDGKRALIAGDYVYERYTKDAHSAVKALHSLAYDAVVVPHHGDLASAAHIVGAKPGAKAFFSAGDHQYYKHPTIASIDGHLQANYAEISDKHCADIRGVRLI